MEKNDLNNKLEQHTEQQFKQLKNGLESLNGMFESAINGAFKTIDDTLTKDEAIRYKAYLNKYLKLSAEGKIKEAEELKQKFSEQF